MELKDIAIPVAYPNLSSPSLSVPRLVEHRTFGDAQTNSLVAAKPSAYRSVYTDGEVNILKCR